ncbi:metal-binding protein ZinT [Roseovarius sp. HI0049]|nr:metal-binding protein ZinT [Roseovarius sp. HI0049]
MPLLKHAAALVTGALLTLTAPALASDTADKDHDHDHSHAESHQSDIYKGYFEDSQIAPRPLSDWEGDWQSVYPYLMDDSLDPVMQHKAEHGDKTAGEYRAYYETGYATDVDRIEITGDRVTFHEGDSAVSGTYAEDGHEILTYKKGNRGVRFIFQKTEGDEEAPDYIQFSDHRIAPAKADHYHLYWGDDRAALLEEVTNWPTYYPADLTVDQIVEEMTAH